MEAAAPPEGEGRRSGPDRRRLYLLLTPIVVLTALAYVGDFVWAGLVEDHPLWLIALNTRKRYLALVVPHTDPIPYYVVGTLRQVMSDPLFFLLGRWYGDSGVRWLERKLGEGGSMVRFMERGFAKASWPMVAVFPNALVCMLAGASAMPVWLFLVLNVGGTFVAMVVLRLFGDVFGGPIAAFTGFVNDYRLPIIALSGVLVAVNIAMNKKKGTSELESVASLERELEDEVARDEPGPPTIR
jgi:membrane protein DedA with SNARE-associated domain